MSYTITYYSKSLQADIMALPVTLQARYIGLTARMMEYGANLGQPHTEAFGDGLFELRLKGAEGIARWLADKSSCCTVSSRRHRRRRSKNARLQKNE